MPPWFLAAMAQCEALSLDVRSDRQRLFDRLMASLPRDQIAHAIADNLHDGVPGGQDPDVITSRIQLAVVAALEEG